jgi:formiminoglutamase
MAEIAPFVPFDQHLLNSLLKYRKGEEKLGEHITYPGDVPLNIFLEQNDFKYAIFGIPEDIGVMANFGQPGAKAAWSAFLTAFLNTQSNNFLEGHQMAILGHLDLKYAYHRLPEESSGNFVAEARKLTASLDEAVWRLVTKIIRSGKVPIIIGGGHNNSYGNLRGFSNALGKPVNCINLDPHADFRPMEGRHSGNGFRYAMEEGYLSRYFVYGLHEAYNSKNMLAEFDSREHLDYLTFEKLRIRGPLQIPQSLDTALAFVCKAPFGIEVDLDGIAYMPSSAMSPSGFSVELVREFVAKMAGHKHAGYFHVCEGAPLLGGTNGPMIVGKTISYLVQDFIKSHQKL